jgi:transposase-like protein
MDRIVGALQAAFADRDGLRRLLEVVVNAAMNGEVAAHVGAAPHERSDARRGHRNGHKPRALNTRVGELALPVPPVRGCEPYHPSMFNKWQRSERAPPVARGEVYFQGVSTRNVRDVLEAMCGGGVSAMTVSRVAQGVDEKLAASRDRRGDWTGSRTRT